MIYYSMMISSNGFNVDFSGESKDNTKSNQMNIYRTAWPKLYSVVPRKNNNISPERMINDL